MKGEDGKVLKRVRELRDTKSEKDSGKIFCIPFSNYPKLSRMIPGIVPGMISMVTASSGVGKTQIAKALFVREPLEYCLKNKIKLKIIYFALEESREEFIDTMICNYVSSKGVKIDLLTLQGFRENSITEESMANIEQHINEIESLLEAVEIVDSVYNPTGAYQYCRDYADKNGTHHFEDKEFIKKNSDGTTSKSIVKVYSHYTPNDPNEFVIVIMDHLSLLVAEKDSISGNVMTQHQTMAKWSTHYCLKHLTKHWKWHVCNIIQQEQSSEGEQFTNKGESIVKKTEPSLSNFANNKEIQRDSKLIIGVYSPDRYGFEEYHDYNIRRFKDSFRGIKILKNRFGSPNKYIHFLFDGASNRFVELPLPKEKDELEKFYKKADRLTGRIGAPIVVASSFGNVK